MLVFFFIVMINFQEQTGFETHSIHKVWKATVLTYLMAIIVEYDFSNRFVFVELN